MKNLFGKIKSLLSRILGKNKGEDRPAEGGLSQAKNIQIDDRKALKKGKYGFEGQLINDIADHIAKCKDYDGPLHAKAFRALYIYKRCLEEKEKEKDEKYIKKYISESIGIKSDGSLALARKYETDLKEEFDKLETTFHKIREKMEEDYTFLTSIRHSWAFIRALEKGGGDIIYLYHFKTLFAFTEADGDISLSELLYIRSLMRKYIANRNERSKIERSKIDSEIKEMSGGGCPNNEKDIVEKIKGSSAISKWFLSDLIALAYVDGKCDKDEYCWLKKMASNYSIKRNEFVQMLMKADRIAYSPIERLKKDYWEKELSLKWWNKILDIWFLPFSGIGKIIRVCVTKNSSGRVVAAFIIVIVGIYVYMYSMNDNLWEAIIESTSSFFRSYGGFRGERGGIAAQKYVYYWFQMLTMLFVIGLTFFHFGKEVGNEVNRKKAIFNITGYNCVRLIGLKWIWKCLLRCLVILVPLVVLTVGVWLSCGGIPQPIKVGEVSIVKDRTNIVMDVGMSIEGSGVFTNRLGHSEIVLECNTNRFIASIINTEKVENKEIIFPNKLWDLLNEIYYGINLFVTKFRFFVVNILFDACTYIDLWNNVCNFCDDLWNFMVRPYYLPILKGCHSCSFFISLLLWYLALSILVRIVVCVINFVGFLFKLNFYNRHKLYVIWGGVSNGELRDETIALMADIRRSKGGYVLVMLDKDSIEKERYDGITDYLREFDVCWKYVSYGRLNKYDAYGDYHFFIDKEGRKNRVMAQSVIDRLKKDNEDRFLVMRTRKPQLHVLVKHSTEHDLANWLSDPVVRKMVDLRIFNVAEIVSDDLFEQVLYSQKSKPGEKIKILFLGMGRNSRAIIRKMFLIPHLVGKEMNIRICESDNENRWRFLLYLLDILAVFNSVYKIRINEIRIKKFSPIKAVSGRNWDLGKGKSPREVLELMSKYDNFYKEEGENKCIPGELKFEINGIGWNLTFEDLNVMSSKFKVWALNNIFDFEGKDFSYDYIFSCLGDSHNSLTTMRRIERIYCRETYNKGLPTDKYFMQLKDSRYASMYESKINGEVSVFGDLRRVFSVESITGQIKRSDLDKIHGLCIKRAEEVAKNKNNEKLREKISCFLLDGTSRIFIKCCSSLIKDHEKLDDTIIRLVLVRLYLMLTVGDKSMPPDGGGVPMKEVGCLNFVEGSPVVTSEIKAAVTDFKSVEGSPVGTSEIKATVTDFKSVEGSPVGTSEIKTAVTDFKSVEGSPVGTSEIKKAVTDFNSVKRPLNGKVVDEIVRIIYDSVKDFILSKKENEY